MNIADEYEHAGVNVQIHYETDTEHANPRTNGDAQLAVFYCWHPNYNLGDEQFTRNDHDSMADVVEFLRTERKAVVILPLFLYDHSGISISAGAPLDLEAWSAADIEARDRFVGDSAGWDTSMVGYAYATIERADELGAPHDKLAEQTANEVEEYDLYLTGQVYGYVVGEDTPFEDSCWGFLGDVYVKEAANEAAESIAQQLEREKNEAAEWAARDTITV